jgi:gamma-glutamyl-gamma-aminobutyrate hydrolase PuuD
MQHRLKIGISACFFHADAQRPIFTGKTLQYVEQSSGDRIRDEYEIALTHAFVAAGKPVLGICRGLQLLNVAFGGTLYQDIPTQRPGAAKHRDTALYDLNFHALEISAGSRLAQLCGSELRRVNSVHHQAIKDHAPLLADFLAAASSVRPAP